MVLYSDNVSKHKSLSIGGAYLRIKSNKMREFEGMPHPSPMSSPFYAPHKKDLGNRAHPACPYLGISRHQSDCSMQYMGM